MQGGLAAGAVGQRFKQLLERRFALLIAGLCANGTTEIYNIHQIDRGYERVDEKLRTLGAQIQRLPAHS